MKILICQKIRNLRLQEGLSQEKVANYLHMSQNAYSALENGKVKKIDIERLSKIAALYKKDITYFFETT